MTARKKRAALEAPATPSADTDQLDDLLAEIGPAQAVARVERLHPINARGYLGTVELTPDFLDVVKQNYGGGSYSARIADPGGVYKRRIAFTIAGAVKEAGPELVAAPTSASSELAELRATVRELVDVVRRPPAHDVVSLLAPILDISKQLAGTMHGGGGGSSVTDALALHREIREAIAEEKESRRPPREGGGMAALFREFLPPLLSAMQAPSAAPPPTPAVIPPPTLAAPPAPPMPPPIPIPDRFAWLAMMRPYLPELAKYQAAKHPAADVAQATIKAVPVGICEQIEESAEAADFTMALADTLAQLHPALASDRAWLLLFAAGIKEEVSDDPPADPPST